MRTPMDAQPPPHDWLAILRALEARLEALALDGVNWLNIQSDPTLQALLLEKAAEEAAAKDSREEAHPPKPARSGSSGAIPPSDTRDDLEGPAGSASGETTPTGTAGRARRLAAMLQRGTPSEDASKTPGSNPPENGAQEEPAPDAPRPAAIHTLESLWFQHRDCHACKLASTRTRLVFGVGNERPRILFIGEGPGAEEDAQGLPFVGRAGRLLTGLILAMGLTRDDVYITNVIKCRPPGNRNPEPDEIASCRPMLQRQMELLDPRLIVTLGNVPLKVLNPSAKGITTERGRIFAHGPWQVLPTFHPSYLLRNPAAIQQCWIDFRKALEVAYGSA